MNEYTVPIITVLISGAVSAFSAWLVYRSQNRRMDSQNLREDMDTAQIALQISENSTKKQLELEGEIHKLKKILTNTHYRVTVIFKLGDPPTIDTASIEAINTLPARQSK